MEFTQFSPKLSEEVKYRFDLMVETAENDGESLPFLDDDTIYWIFGDIEASDLWSEFKWEIMDWYIAKGVYAYITDAEYKATHVSSSFPGAKARAFPKHRGKRVKFVKHLGSVE